jgi:hypothetical protein
LWSRGVREQSRPIQSLDRFADAENAMKSRTEGAVWSATVKAVALCAVIWVLSPLKIVSPAEAGSDIRGCWERIENSTRYPTSLTYCFLGKGRLQGWGIDYGHGVDFYGSWERHRHNRVSIAIRRASRITCSYEFDEPRDVLHLKNCTAPSVEGSFNRSSVIKNKDSGREN